MLLNEILSSSVHGPGDGDVAGGENLLDLLINRTARPRTDLEIPRLTTATGTIRLLSSR